MGRKRSKVFSPKPDVGDYGAARTAGGKARQQRGAIFFLHFAKRDQSAIAEPNAKVSNHGALRGAVWIISTAVWRDKSHSMMARPRSM